MLLPWELFAAMLTYSAKYAIINAENHVYGKFTAVGDDIQ